MMARAQVRAPIWLGSLGRLGSFMLPYHFAEVFSRHYQADDSANRQVDNADLLPGKSQTIMDEISQHDSRHKRGGSHENEQGYGSINLRAGHVVNMRFKASVFHFETLPAGFLESWRDTPIGCQCAFGCGPDGAPAARVVGGMLAIDCCRASSLSVSAAICLESFIISDR